MYTDGSAVEILQHAVPCCFCNSSWTPHRHVHKGARALRNMETKEELAKRLELEEASCLRKHTCIDMCAWRCPVVASMFSPCRQW